nr:uncharacterized protein LOC105474968 isoform X1 [Macaca nemestrina]
MAACPPPTPAQPFFTQRLKRGERNLLGPGNTPLLRHSLHYSLASSVGNSLPVGGSAADTCKLHTPGWRFQTFMRPVTYCAQGPHRTCFLATCLPTPFEQSGFSSSSLNFEVSFLLGVPAVFGQSYSDSTPFSCCRFGNSVPYG